MVMNLVGYRTEWDPFGRVRGVLRESFVLGMQMSLLLTNELSGVMSGDVLAQITDADAVAFEGTLTPNIEHNLRSQNKNVSINILETLHNV